MPKRIEHGRGEDECSLTLCGEMVAEICCLTRRAGRFAGSIGFASRTRSDLLLARHSRFAQAKKLLLLMQDACPVQTKNAEADAEVHGACHQ